MKRKTNPVARAIGTGRQGKPVTHRDEPSYAHSKGRRRHPKHRGAAGSSAVSTSASDGCADGCEGIDDQTRDEVTDMAKVYEWNYRIVFDKGIWVIREVHYEDNEPLGHCSADLYGETPTELLAQYNQMQEAFKLPILSLTEEATLVEGASPLELQREEENE